MRDMHASIAAAFLRRRRFAESDTTLGTLLHDDLCVLGWFVASLACWMIEVFESTVAQRQWFPDLSELTRFLLIGAVALPAACCLVGLVVSRFFAHSEWIHAEWHRDNEEMKAYATPDCEIARDPHVAAGIGWSRLCKTRLYRTRNEANEWDTVLRVEPLLCRIIGALLIVTLSPLGCMFFRMASGLERYGRRCEYEEELRKRDEEIEKQRRAYEEEQRRQEIFIASVVSPPRKSYEEVKRSHPSRNRDAGRRRTSMADFFE